MDYNMSGYREIIDIDWEALKYKFENPDEPGEGESVAIGTRVRHPVFGRGEVLAVLGSDLNQKLRIKFERAGVKTVMVKYANLELA